MRIFKMHIIIFFIVLVSVIDIYWLIYNQTIISHVELNPVGQFLIVAGGGNIELFVLCKIIGTAACAVVLYNIFKINKRKGFIIAGMVALFQLCLLFFLYFGHLYIDI